MADGGRLVRATRRRVAVLAAAWVAVVCALALAPGCYGRNCDPSTAVWGENPGEGNLLDEDTWESNPVDEPWLELPGARSWVFTLKPLGTRPYKLVLPYVSGSPDPMNEPSNYTVGSGNGAVIASGGPGRLIVANGTCADYYLRLVVIALPDDGGADASADGGADASADPSSSDAAANPDASDGGV